MRSSRSIRKGHRLFTVFAALVTMAQSVVAIAPLTEGIDGRMQAHVESRGVPTHVLHNEATCAACQARSIQGTTSAPSTPVIAVAHPPAVAVAMVDRAVTTDANPQQHPRAPPRVI
ncbi:MAG: hypothetical protein ACHQWU_02245 [Gemmatimonadales bacterium]|jgi:hypothetical protein